MTVLSLMIPIIIASNYAIASVLYVFHFHCRYLLLSLSFVGVICVCHIYARLEGIVFAPKNLKKREKLLKAAGG